MNPYEGLVDPSAPPIMFSQSGVSADWQCPRKRYYSNEFHGVGLSAGETNIYYFLGVTLHDGLAAIAAGVEIDAIADAAVAQVKETLLKAESPYGLSAEETAYASEQAALVEGILRGFHKHVWPRMISSYEIMHPEMELLYKYGPGLAFMSKPDLIVRDKDDQIWAVEYKSTGWSNEKWINSWGTAVQVHSQIKAIEQTLGLKVAGVIVQGLFKGSHYMGKQSSPFCYGYRMQSDASFIETKWAYEYRKGYQKAPVWEKPGGVKEWVNAMPEELLAQQFPQVPPIFINNELITTYFDQRAMREREISMASTALMNPELSDQDRKAVLDMTFPQRFDQCKPSFGSPCHFVKLCHSPMGDDPIRAGFFLRDTSHRDGYKRLL